MIKRVVVNIVLVLGFLLSSFSCKKIEENKRIWALEEYQKVVGKKSLIELKRYKKYNPESIHLPGIDEEIDKLYDEATLYIKEHRVNNEEFYDFISELVEYLRSNKGDVQVRFKTLPLESLQAMDKIVTALIDEDNEYYNKVLPFSEAFSNVNFKNYESSTISQLESVLNILVPYDLISLNGAGRIPEHEELESYDLPSINIEYRLIPNSSIYSSYDSNTYKTNYYLGLGFIYTITMTLPESDKVYTLELELDPPDEFIKKSSSNESLYVTMADLAFRELAVKIYENILNVEADISVRLDILTNRVDRIGYGSY